MKYYVESKRTEGSIIPFDSLEAALDWIERITPYKNYKLYTEDHVEVIYE